MQYTLIIDLENYNSKAGDEKYAFKNFNEPHELINYVSNMSKGGNKVHKIVQLWYTGEVKKMTIGFKNGQLDLINLPVTE